MIVQKQERQWLSIPGLSRSEKSMLFSPGSLLFLWKLRTNVPCVNQWSHEVHEHKHVTTSECVGPCFCLSERSMAKEDATLRFFAQGEQWDAIKKTEEEWSQFWPDEKTEETMSWLAQGGKYSVKYLANLNAKLCRGKNVLLLLASWSLSCSLYFPLSINVKK